MSASYHPLSRGAKVEFLHKGDWLEGVVTEVTLDPNRRPGIGRVSYDVKFHPAFAAVKVAARNVRATEAK